jgi:hypothetical protein
MKQDVPWVSNAKKRTPHSNASITRLNTKLIHAMYTIRRDNSWKQRMRKLSRSRWYREGSLRSAREGISALFIMIKLKREILIKVHHSDLPLLFKLSLTPIPSSVSVTRVQTMEDL